MVTLRLIVLVLFSWCLLSGAALADGAADDKDAKDLRTWQRIQQPGNHDWVAQIDPVVTQHFVENPPTSFADVEEYYVNLAMAGNIEGRHAVGLMYNFGLGSFPRDSCLALLWHYNAAVSHYASSINVGLSYLRGIGVRPDLETAYIWIAWATEFSEEPFVVPEWEHITSTISRDRRIELEIESISSDEDFYFDFDPIILPDLLRDPAAYPEAAKLLADEGLARCDF